jgi:hypothetical protein
MNANKLAPMAAWGVWLLPAMVIACGGKDEPSDSDAPSVDELEIVDLGSHSVFDTGGYTGDIDVIVPDGAISTVMYCGGWGDDALGAIWTVTDPDGNMVYDGDNPDPMKYRAEFLDDMAPGLVPITPNLDLRPGTWKFNWFIGGGNPGSVNCKAVFRVDDVGNEANIQVNLVFVGLDGIDAGSAPDDANMNLVLDQLKSEWASAGLNPSFTYTDFSGAASFTVINVTETDYSEFNNLLRTASPDNDRSITFFLVEEISSGDGTTILGLSGGPPGAATFQGTSKSGVIVTTVDLADDPESVAKIMAHEGGHFLGLYHTTEKDGSQFDPISDTPECPTSNDSNGNGTMNSDECAGKGAENVMWWTLTQGTATFSNDQGWVLRRNPAAD